MSLTPPLRIGVIGTGWWAVEAHLPAIAQHPQATIAAIQTRKAEKGRFVAEKFDVPHIFATADELLAHPGLDAVIISSTPQVHFEQAKAAMERGLHVLLEKPMTIRAAESAELVGLANERGLQFLVSCPWHYTRHGVLARQRIAEGALGSIRLISVFMTNFTLGLYEGQPFAEALAGTDGTDASLTPDVPPNLDSYSDASIAGGGHIYCQASHIFAYLGFLTGLNPVEISARFDCADTAVDATNVMHLAFEGGALGTVATGATRADVERAFEIRIVGTRGILFLELWQGRMRLRLNDGTVETPNDLAEDEIYPKFAPALNLVDAILGRAGNGSPASLGYYAVNLIEAASQSAASRASILFS